MTAPTILMFSEDLHLHQRLGWLLESRGCRLFRAGNDKALALAVNSREFDLILAQVNWERARELDILHQVKQLHPRTRIILLSHGNMTLPLEAYQMEVDDYLFLPCRPGEIWRRVLACLSRPLEKNRNLMGRPRPVSVNRAILQKVQHVCQYFDYALGSSMSALQSLINSPQAGLPDDSLTKIQGVFARLESLQEMMGCFHRAVAGEGATGGCVKISTMP